MFNKAKRIQALPPYLFAEIDRKKRAALAKGVDLIDLGIGDPDIPTPGRIIERLTETVTKPANHRYPSSSGMMEFRQAVADWYDRRFGVTLDPATEVCSLIGSKEGVANMAVAYVDPGDVVLVPTPGYPVYEIGTNFNGGEVFFMPLRRENGFLPDLSAIPADVLGRAKMMWLNYPNNPTGAVTDESFLKEAVDFARRHKIVLCHDAAYTELGFDGYRAPSILQVDGAKEVAIELHSLSKTFNMTGWRIAMAVGCPELVATLAQVKSNVDSGVFQPVQEAAILALEHAEEFLGPIREVYQERRDTLLDGLHQAGFELPAPRATFYVWLPVPGGWSSADFTARLLDEAGIVTTPGNGFGEPGEGFIRMTLCSPADRLKEAVQRLQQISL
ncbi:MAG: LL-diaminopimelate aminotransferase [Deltaproteobacteria bacterium]|nr:LL-diaminopimelate aminotransferase [Deltaproteobacteria bacterium]